MAALSKWGSPSIGLVPDHRQPATVPLIVETDPQGRVVKTSHDNLPPEQNLGLVPVVATAPRAAVTVDRVRAWLAERGSMIEVVTRDLETARAHVTELEAMLAELERLRR